MPVPRSKAKTPAAKVSGSDLLKKRVQQNYDIANDPNSSQEEKQEVVCDFFRSGNHPDCHGCDQNEDRVNECSAFYVSRILDKMQLKWDKAFSATIVPAQKTTLQDARKQGLTMQCNDCYLNDRCPLMKKGSACSIDWGVDPLLLNDTQKAMDYLIHMQLERVGRARMIEEMDGGVPDQNLSVEMDRLADLLSQKADMNNIKIKQINEVVIPTNGEAKPTPQQESILERIFNKKPVTQLPAGNTTQVIDVTHEVVEPVKQTK